MKERVDLIQKEVEAKLLKVFEEKLGKFEKQVVDKVTRNLTPHSECWGEHRELMETYARSAVTQILTEMLKQSNTLRFDVDKLSREVQSLKDAEKVFLQPPAPEDSEGTSTKPGKVKETLSPTTFWKYVFIENQKINPSRFEKLAQIDFQLKRLWNCLLDEISVNSLSVTAGALISAFQKFVNSDPAPNSFLVASNKLFALLRLWNFNSNCLTPEFQAKIKNMFFTELQIKFQTRRKFRLPHSPIFLRELCQTQFGPDTLSIWTDFQPRKLSKNLSLRAALILTFFLGNRAPELANVLTDIVNCFFITEKAYKIGNQKGRLIILKVPVLKHKTSGFGAVKNWTIVFGLAPANVHLKKRKVQLTIIGQAFLYLHRFKSAKNSLLNDAFHNKKLATALTSKVRQIYADLDLGVNGKTFYSGKNSLIHIALLLKISKSKINSFIGWRTDMCDTYSNDPHCALQCSMSEIDPTIRDLISLNIKMANKSTTLRAYTWGQ